MGKSCELVIDGLCVNYIYMIRFTHYVRIPIESHELLLQRAEKFPSAAHIAENWTKTHAWV
jgi:hypothetical protein